MLLVSGEGHGGRTWILLRVLRVSAPQRKGITTLREELLPLRRIKGLCYNADVNALRISRTISLALALFSLSLSACTLRSATSLATPAPALPTPTAALAPVGDGYRLAGGSTAKPVSGLRQLKAWGEGVPVALALSPDGATLFVATSLALQRRDAGELSQLIWTQPLDSTPAALALSPDGITLALAVAEQVRLIGAADGAPLISLSHSSAVHDLAFAPDGALLATALNGKAVVLWDLATGKPLRELRLRTDTSDQVLPAAFTSVAFDPVGTRVAAGDANGNLVIWRTRDGTQLLNRSVGLRVVTDVAFTPDGAAVAAASEGWRSEAGAVWVWDTSSGTELARLSLAATTQQLEPLLQLAFTATGDTLVAGTASGRLLRWAWPTGKLEHERPAHMAAINTLLLTPGGGIFSAGRDGAIRRWNADGRLIDELEGLPAISAVAVGANQVIAAGEDGSLHLWDRNGNLLLQRSAHVGPINALGLSPNGRMLASVGDDGLVRLWAMPAISPLAELAGHSGPVLAVAISPDGRYLASAGSDGTVRLWRVPEAHLEQIFTVIEADGLSSTAVLGTAFSTAGIVAGTSYDGTVRLFDRADGTALRALRTEVGGWLIALAPGPAGTLVALDDAGRLWSWAADGTPSESCAVADAAALASLNNGQMLSVGPAGGLRLWQIGTSGPTELAVAASPGDSLAVAADGRLVVVGARLGQVELWELP